MRNVFAPPVLRPIDRWSWLVLSLMIAANVLIYTRTLYYPTTEWDDTGYITANEELNGLSWDQVKIEFGRNVMGNYHPITMLSYAMDIAIAGGKRPWMFHLSNVLLHIINCMLVFALLWRLTGEPLLACGTALLFGVHPMRVEAVAWVADRKDLLLLFFGCLALMSYVNFVRSRRWQWFCMAYLLFVLACLSKGTAVAFALVLLAIDIFHERRLRTFPVWLEKLPFFLTAFVFGYLAVQAQHTAKAIPVDFSFDVGQRTMIALGNIVMYAAHQLVPVRLCALVGYAGNGREIPSYFPYLLPILGVMVYLVVRYRSNRVVLFASLFFLFNIILLLQFMSVGRAIRADRYTYVASIGWTLLLVHLMRTVRFRIGSLGEGSFLLLLLPYASWLGVQAHQRTAAWNDAISVWNDLIRGNPNDAHFYSDRGATYFNRGLYELGLADQNRSLQIKPDLEMAYFNRGMTLIKMKRYEEGLKDLIRVFQSGVPRPTVFPNMIYALIKLGNYQDVIANCTAYLRIEPSNLDVLAARAYSYLQLGEPKKAAADVEQGLSVTTENGMLWYLQAKVHLAGSDTVKACTALERSLQWPLVDADYATDRLDLQGSVCGKGPLN